MANFTGKALVGSNTAKGGFANEKAVVQKFNNYKTDTEAKQWLALMGYDYTKITSLIAQDIPSSLSMSKIKEYESDETKIAELKKFKKADIQIKLTISIGDITSIENLSLKKANIKADFNQVDKRAVEKYKEIWGFSNSIELWLKLFTGAERHQNHPLLFKGVTLKNSKRIFMKEMPIKIQNDIIKFFDTNKFIVASDILKGRGGLSANWILVTRHNIDKTTSWVLKDIAVAINFFLQGTVKISPKGSLDIGRIGMQRKGGKPDPDKLQFKIHPNQLFSCP